MTAPPPAVDDLAELAKQWSPSPITGSRELKLLDRALAAYAKASSAANRTAVVNAFKAWKATKAKNGGTWEDSKRMKDGGMQVQRLNAILSPGGDSDRMFGTESFMVEDAISARQGVLFLFGNLTVSTNWAKLLLDGGLSIAASGTGFAGGFGDGNGAAGIANEVISSSRMVLDPASDHAIDAFQNRSTFSGPVAPHLGVTAVASFTQKLKTFLEWVQKVKEQMIDRWGAVDLAFSGVNLLISQLVGKLAAEAAPFLSAGKDIATGITRTIDRGMANFKEWKARQGVVLSSGHPAAVVAALELQMRASLAEGLWEVLKGATSIGLTFVAGASVIFDLVVAGVEMLIKYIWHFCESWRLKAFCAEASEQWTLDKGRAFASKPFAFHAWFRKAALFIPTIPALTLNSGYCGDKMVWLKVFNEGASGAVTKDEQLKFDKGVTLLDDHLKPFGASYLRSCPYELSSSMEQVTTAIERSQAITSREKEHQAWRLWKAFLGVEAYEGVAKPKPHQVSMSPAAAPPKLGQHRAMKRP